MCMIVRIIIVIHLYHTAAIFGETKLYFSPGTPSLTAMKMRARLGVVFLVLWDYMTAV